jgi:hypothetical protein
VLAYVWDKLGLGRSGSYGYREYELHRLRAVFGRRTPSAYYVLDLLRTYGAQAYKEPLSLLSKSMYYSYRTLLVEHGFITVQDDESVQVVRPALPALHLPTCEVYEELHVDAQNLGFSTPPMQEDEKEKFWRKLADGLQLSSNAQPLDYLRERVYAA